jgi:hypothetical protein
MSRSKWIPVAFAAAFSFAVFAQGQPSGGANSGGGAGGQGGQAGNAAGQHGAAGANNNEQSGEAIVVTRDGPTIALENGAQPIIAVAFPSQQGQQQPAAQQQQQGQEGIEISALVANPNDVAKPKEVLFQSANAANGMVVYSGNELVGPQTASAQQAPAQPGQPAQNAKEKQSQLIFSARVNGRMAKVTELVSQGNARILIVKHEDQAQAKAGQPAKPGQAQPAAAQQAGQKEKAQAEQNDAVIFIYLRGEQAK